MYGSLEQEGRRHGILTSRVAFARVPNIDEADWGEDPNSAYIGRACQRPDTKPCSHSVSIVRALRSGRYQLRG